MFEKGANTRSKREVSVVMSLSGDEFFEATVFLLLEERLIDLLNDKRAFIPVKRKDGATIIVAKSNIISVIERGEVFHKAAVEDADAQAEYPNSAEKAERDDPETGDASQGEKPKKPSYTPRGHFDPYKTLRVSKDATDEEVRRAFKTRMKAVHPDTLAGLDLDDEIGKAAILASQRVNYAYQKIMKDRKAASAETIDGAQDSTQNSSAA